MADTKPGISLSLIALLLFSAAGLVAFWTSLDLPSETEGLGFLDYPLILHQYDSFWQWLLRDFPEKMHFIRPVPFFIQGLIVTGVENHTALLRLVNLTALVISGWLLFKLLRRESVNFQLSILAGMILILHPINVINVLKIIHLGYLLGGMFCLLALNIYASFRDREKPFVIYLLEAGIIAAMLLSYELYVVAPLLLLLYEFFIKAEASSLQMKVRYFFKSLLLWGGLVGGYLLLRLIAFHGVGGYADFWERNPLAPFLKGGKWLSGWGFLHILGQPLGLLDIALLMILAAVVFFIILNKENRTILAFAIFWFIAASLPYFVITATYHYVFAFSLIGCIFALCLSYQRRLKGKVLSKAVGYAALLLLLMFWLYGHFPATASVIAGIENDHVPAQIIADQIGKEHDQTLVFLASASSDRHIQVRLALLLHPAQITLMEILPPLSPQEENRLYEADSSGMGYRIYALREGRNVAFQPNLSSLLQAAQQLNPPAGDTPRPQRRRP